MKKFSSLLSLSAIALLAAGCAKEVASPEISTQKDGLWAVFEQPVNGDDTKALGSDYMFFWKDAEKITVFGATDGEQLTYRMEASSTAAGKFHATNFKLIEDETYYAVYPALGTVDDMTAVPVSFEGQVQSANDDTGHLAQYAYSTANATVSGNSATFNFSTKVAWFKFDFTFLSDETVNSIELKAGSSVIPTSAVLDVKAGTLIADKTSDHLTLSLSEDGIATVGKKLTAHLAVLPFASESNLSVTVSCKSGSVYTTTIPALTLEANKYYTASRVIAPATPVLNAEKYYEVHTPEHWNWVANTCHINGAKGIRLMSDLCFNGGEASDIYNWGGGVTSLSIDGNGHKISNLVVKYNSVDGSDRAYGGLIRSAVNDITIKNLEVDDIKVDVSVNNPNDVCAYAGALLGYVSNKVNVAISNVTVKHADVKGVQSVGGLVGFVACDAKLTVSNCTVGDSYIHNYAVEDESGCVHGMVGRVIGEVEFTGSNKVENTSIEAYYCPKRGETSIGEVAGAGAKDGTPSITGLDSVNSENNVTVTKTLVVPAVPSLVNGVWEIYTVGQWEYVAGKSEVDASGAIVSRISGHKKNTEGIKLCADLDFEGATTGGLVFSDAGIDGAGHTISNVCIKIPGSAYSHGLIRGELSDGEITVSDIKFKNAKVLNSITDGAYAGLIFGDVQQFSKISTATLDKISVDGLEVKGIQGVGSLVGFVSQTSILNISNCSVNNAVIFNHESASESGYVCGLVGKVVGTLNIGEGNTLSETAINGNYAGSAAGRPITTIDAVAAVRGSGVINGADKLTLTNVTVNASLIPGSTLTINGTIGADMAEASAYINASSEKKFDIVFTADNTWETGNAGDGANTIFTDGNTTVNINLNCHALTMTGAGGFKSNAKLDIKNGTVVDRTLYDSENGETAWEFTYLELEGAEMTFENVTFSNSMMTKSANAVFKTCTFNGVATLESNQREEYAVWVNDGKASFKQCIIGNGYRGLKLGDLYSANVSSLVVEDCTFADLSKKPGIAIDSKHNATIVIRDCKFNDTQIGEQGNFIYETDNVVPTLSGNVIGISKAETLKAVATAVNQMGQTFSGYTFNLLENIDLQNEAWTPIGLIADNPYRFAGVFDGKNKTISNLKVDQTAAHTSAGLFGAVVGATIKNFTLNGVKVESVVKAGANGTVDGIGAVAGSAAYGAYISGVTVRNAELNGNRYIGGIVGYSGGDVTGCSVENLNITCTPDNLTGSYDNGDKAGGIIGHTNSGKYTDGNITGNKAKNVSITAYRDLGGIVGSAYLGTYNVKNNSIEGYINLTVDQKTNSYGTKDANAAAIVGRILSGSLDSSNNVDAANVSIK